MTGRQVTYGIEVKRVLWVPVEGDRSIPLAERRVGSPLLWVEEVRRRDEQLRLDWERADGHDSAGRVERITARHGEVLQLRPKAANAGNSPRLSARAGNLAAWILSEKILRRRCWLAIFIAES